MTDCEMSKISFSRANIHKKKNVVNQAIKASDVALLRNLFKDSVRGKSNSVNVSEFLVSIEQSGPSYDSLKIVSRVLFQDKLRSLHAVQLTFYELLTVLYPDIPTSMIQQLIQQVAPSLYEVESDVDNKIQDDLDRLGQARIMDGETIQARRVRLAISRTALLPTNTSMHEPECSDSVAYQDYHSTNVAKAKNIHKPIIRVAFNKRSLEAKRLKEYSTIGRPLLSVDGLPLHSNPLLQLHSGNDDIDDEPPNDKAAEGIGNSNLIMTINRNEKKTGYKLRRDERNLSIFRHSAKAHVGSSYGHLFHKRFPPESELAKLLCLIENDSIEQVATFFYQLIGQKYAINSTTLRSVILSGIKNERPDISVQCFLRATTIDGDPAGIGNPACEDVDLACYNSLIEAYGCSGNLQAAMNVKEIMSLHHITPNGETYNSWIRVAIINDSAKLTKSLLHEMVRNGWIHALARDIKHALGEENIQGILETRACDTMEKEQATKSFLSVPFNKKFSLTAARSAQGHANASPARQQGHATGTLSDTLNSKVQHDRSDLTERIDALQSALQVLDEDKAGFLSEREHIVSRLAALHNEVQSLSINIESAPEPSSFLPSGDTRPDIECPLGLDLNGGPKQKQYCYESPQQENEPGMKILIKSLSGRPQSFSKQVDYVLKRPPYLITKTITATPKSYSSGEFTIVVTLKMSEPVQSRHGDGLTINIQGFSDIPMDDCDLLIFGIGKRLCVDGSAKWLKSTGCISIDLADNAVLPSDYPAVFRFSLFVDTERNHSPVTTTVTLYNKSRSFEIPALKMDGDILQFTASAHRKKKPPSVSEQVSENAQPDPNSCIDTEICPMDLGSANSAESIFQTKNFVDWGSNLGTGEVKKQAYCLDRGFINSWRPHIIKVFFSASIEMRIERQVLESKVWLSLQQLCEASHSRFILVDLRAGLTLQDEMHTCSMTLMLDEASTCHYFVCMLGDDYGWHQPVEPAPEMFDEALKEIHCLQSNRAGTRFGCMHITQKTDGSDQSENVAIQESNVRNSKIQSLSHKPQLQTMASKRMLVAGQRITSELKQRPSPLVRQNSFANRIHDKVSSPISTSPSFPGVMPQSGVSPDILLNNTTSTERKGLSTLQSKKKIEGISESKQELPIIIKSKFCSDLVRTLDTKGSPDTTLLPVLTRNESEKLKNSPSKTNISVLPVLIKHSDCDKVQAQSETLNGFDDGRRPMRSFLDENLNGLTCLSKMPQGSDSCFFLNQLHAMKHGHMWIKNHTESGLIELEILHRLHSDISSQHRCLIFIQSDEPNLEYVGVKKSMADAEAIKKLLKLKKKLRSGEYGKCQVFGYLEPKTGAEMVGVQLENLISIDWLSGRQGQIRKTNIKLLKLEDPHHSFAITAAAGCFDLNAKQDLTISAWMARSDTDSPFVLHGVPGSGRSSFLARLWQKQLEMKRWDSCVIHFAEVDSSGVRAIMRCCAAFSSAFCDLEALPGQFNEICTAFARIQAKEVSAVSCKTCKVLLVLDSVHDLCDENGSNVHLFEHLPKKFPNNVKLVMSISSDRRLLSWPITHQWALCEVPTLSKTECANLVAEYLKVSQRKDSHLLELLTNSLTQESLQVRAVSLSLFIVCHYDFVLEGSSQIFCAESISSYWEKIIHSSENSFGQSIVRVVLISLSLCHDGLSLEELLGIINFAEERMPAGSEEVIDRNKCSPANVLTISAILWPFKKYHNIWFRYNLINIHSYLKPILEKYYSLDSPDPSLKQSWHILLANFFIIPGTNPERVIREYPYHLMKANENEKLKQFLTHPQWCVEIVSRCFTFDLFQYWRSTGKTWLSDSYTRVLFRPQCWGCACQRNKTDTWVDDFIKQGHAMNLRVTRIADLLEKEIVQRTGKKLWVRDDILEHFRFHSPGGKASLLPSPFFSPAQSKSPNVKDSQMESGILVDWDDINAAHTLRIILQILRDSIDRVTIPAIKRLREGKMRIAKAEELEKIIPRELSKLNVLSKVLLMIDNEQAQHQANSPLLDDYLPADATEIKVLSAADLGIIGQANFPFSMKIGDEVMTATKIEGTTISVIRNNRRKRLHESCFLVNFLFRLPSNRKQEFLPNLKDRIASFTGEEVGQIRLSKSYLDQLVDKNFIYDESELEWKCSVQCSSETEAQHLQELIECSGSVERLASTKKMAETNSSSNEMFEYELIEGPTIAFYRPHVYVEVAVPNRLKALDHYWGAHIADSVGDKVKCEDCLKRCIQILEQISLHSDHLLIQCKVFLWLICAEHGNRRVARERAQALINFEKEWFHAGKNSDGHISCASKSSRYLFNLTREADDIMHGEPIKFQDKVRCIRQLLSPCTLHDIESASYLPISEMWLSVFIDQAQDLLPMDLNGLDDPFCTVSLNEETKSTDVHMRRLNVRFDEELLFHHIQPDPDSVVLIDVWDWDGPGRQDLIGFCQLTLQAALAQEGELVVFTLRRQQKGRGVQAEGIKLGTSGSCGYISVRFHFSVTLRQALINCRQTSPSQEAVQHRLKSFSVERHEAVRNLTLLEPETWDETMPISSSDEGSWIERISFLNDVGDTDEIARRVSLESLKSYFQSCKIHNVYPHSELLDYIELFVLGKASPILSLRSLVEGDGCASIIAAMPVVMQLPCITCLELGSCRVDGNAAGIMFPVLSMQTALQSLFVQSNTIGDGVVGINALMTLFKAPASCVQNLVEICLAKNRLDGGGIAKFLLCVASDSSLLSLDLSHNNARNLGAVAIAYFLRHNSMLKDFNCSWNQIGSKADAERVTTSNMKAGGKNHDAASSQYEILEASTMRHDRHSKELLLFSDTDGRWARHLLQENQELLGFEEGLTLVFKLCDLEQEVESFLNVYTSYLSAAQVVKLKQENLGRDPNSTSEMLSSDVQTSELQAGSAPAAFKEVLHVSQTSSTDEVLFGQLQSSIADFQRGRDCAFKSRDDLFKALESQSRINEARLALSEIRPVNCHPMFSHLRSKVHSSAFFTMCSALEANSSLESFDLSWNRLGNVDAESLYVCEAIATCLSAPCCCLKYLNLAHNNLCLVKTSPASLRLLADSCLASSSLQRLALDGNRMSVPACRFLAMSCSSNDTIKLSLRNCCDKIVHPIQFDIKYPCGKYALDMEDLASRNFVRSLISLVCRQQGEFKNNQVDHAAHDPEQPGIKKDVVSLPDTEFMKWKDWNVPKVGTVSFEFNTIESNTGPSVLPQGEFQKFLDTFGSEISTPKRRHMLSELLKSKYILSSQQESLLSGRMRDFPERCFFLTQVRPSASELIQKRH